MKSNILYWFSIGTLLTALGAIVFFFTLQLYPFKVVELEELKVLSKEAKRDEPIKVSIKFEKYHQYSATSQWSLVCKDGFTIGCPR